MLVFYNVAGDAQAETCPLPYWLCGEEVLKEPLSEVTGPIAMEFT